MFKALQKALVDIKNIVDLGYVLTHEEVFIERYLKYLVSAGWYNIIYMPSFFASEENCPLIPSKESTYIMTDEEIFYADSVTKIYDNHWYTDTEITQLLDYYLQGNNTVSYLIAPLVTSLDAFLELSNNQWQKNSTEDNSVKNKVIIPIRLEQEHWVLLYIIYQQDAEAIIGYFDPLGYAIPENVNVLLADIFRDVTVRAFDKRVQEDDYNCGPWIIEAVLGIVAEQSVVPEVGHDIFKARSIHMALIYPDNNLYDFSPDHQGINKKRSVIQLEGDAGELERLILHFKTKKIRDQVGLQEGKPVILDDEDIIRITTSTRHSPITAHEVHAIVMRLIRRIPLRSRKGFFVRHWSETQGEIYAVLVELCNTIEPKIHYVSEAIKVPEKITILDFSYTKFQRDNFLQLKNLGNSLPALQILRWVHVTVDNAFVFDSSANKAQADNISVTFAFMSFMKALIKLEYLDMSSNQIGESTNETLAGFDDGIIFSKLKTLVLKSNEIYDIKDFSRYRSLRSQFQEQLEKMMPDEFVIQCMNKEEDGVYNSYVGYWFDSRSERIEKKLLNRSVFSPEVLRMIPEPGYILQHSNGDQEKIDFIISNYIKMPELSPPSEILNKIFDYYAANCQKIQLIDLGVNFISLADSLINKKMMAALDKNEKLLFDLSCNSISTSKLTVSKLPSERIIFNYYIVESILSPNHYVDKDKGVYVIATQLDGENDSVGHAITLIEYMGKHGQIYLEMYHFIRCTAMTNTSYCAKADGIIKGKVYNLAKISKERHKNYSFGTADLIPNEKIEQTRTFIAGKKRTGKLSSLPSGNSINCQTFCLRLHEDVFSTHPQALLTDDFISTKTSSVPPAALFGKKIKSLDYRQYIPTGEQCLSAIEPRT